MGGPDHHWITRGLRFRIQALEAGHRQRLLPAAPAPRPFWRPAPQGDHGRHRVFRERRDPVFWSTNDSLAGPERLNFRRGNRGRRRCRPAARGRYRVGSSRDRWDRREGSIQSGGVPTPRLGHRGAGVGRRRRARSCRRPAPKQVCRPPLLPARYAAPQCRRPFRSSARRISAPCR